MVKCIIILFLSLYGALVQTNGNLAQVLNAKQDAGRFHEWDEENRMRFVLGEKYAGYYGYDGNGERVYKLTGVSSIDQVNSGHTKAQAFFDNAILYPNPYIVVTLRGYTKHYYAGTERLATVIGGGGLGDMAMPMDKFRTQREWDIVDAFNRQYQTNDPFLHGKLLSGPTPTEDIDHKQHPELDYRCKPVFLEYVDVLTKTDILFGAIDKNTDIYSKENKVYFYHGDHLGSANWITDIKGDAIQYMHYAPYGELIANQHAVKYDERYKFTGKERDGETGYDYFGARYYSAPFSHWLSVDPLADKYPNISPYAYCGWNPVKYVDPDGEWIAVTSNDDTGTSYIVVGGSVDVEDCNVYVVGNDYDTKSGIKPQGANILAQTATPYSFCNEKGETKAGSVIDMSDKSGDAFIARFQNNEIPLLNYIFDNPKTDGNLSGRNGGNCDFKFGGNVNRGMPLSILGGKIGTARDVGNFAAGYLSGLHGIPFPLTRIAFDCLQKGIEPPVSMSAQNIGYFTGYYQFLTQQKSYYGIK